MRTMGIDLGIRKIAWAVWEEGILTGTGAYESPYVTRPQQLRDVARHIRRATREIDPDAIWIEETLIGNNRKYSIQLSQVMGAVLAELSYWAGMIYLVNNMTWKKGVVGAGNATKEAVHNYIYDRDSAYSVLCGNDQDRYDAACIGFYGVVIANRALALGDSGSTPREHASGVT